MDCGGNSTNVHSGGIREEELDGDMLCSVERTMAVMAGHSSPVDPGKIYVCDLTYFLFNYCRIPPIVLQLRYV